MLLHACQLVLSKRPGSLAASLRLPLLSLSRLCNPLPRSPSPFPDNFRLLDVPVDLLAGALDGIISPACVMVHAQRLRQAGVPCSFRILPAGHMVGGRRLWRGLGTEAGSGKTLQRGLQGQPCWLRGRLQGRSRVKSGSGLAASG